KTQGKREAKDRAEQDDGFVNAKSEIVVRRVRTREVGDCFGVHATPYERINRVAEEIQVSEQERRTNQEAYSDYDPKFGHQLEPSSQRAHLPSVLSEQR